MVKTLFCVAAVCLATHALGSKRFLDSTLLVTKDGLEVLDGTAPVHFKCGSEWNIVFTDNGRTATLNTLKGTWTLTGLSSDVAVAAVSEGAPLVSAVAGGVGVDNVEDVTAKTLGLANKLASTIGSPFFDKALGAAADTVNDVLDDNGIHPSDYTEQIMEAIRHLGPSGVVVDASDVTAEDVHREATKTIGLVLNALASSGAIAIPTIGDLPIAVEDLPIPAKDLPVATEDIAAVAAAGGYGDLPAGLPAGISADAALAYGAFGGK